MDPLSLLRDFCINRQLDQVHVKGDKVHFGERFTFPKAMATSYKSQLGKGDFYGLETLVFFIKAFHGAGKAPAFPDYMQSSRSAGVSYVNFVDRKDLESYLTGATAASQFIQASVPDLVLPSLHEAPDLDGQERASKRARLGQDGSTEAKGQEVTEEDASDLREILAQERVLRDRNTQLLVPQKNFRRALDLLRVTDEADRVAAAKAEKAARAAPPPPPKRAPPPQPPKPAPKAIPILPSGRFDRQTGQDLAAMGMDEFEGANIQAYGVAAAPEKAGERPAEGQRGSAAAAAAPPPPPPGPGPRGPPAAPPHASVSGGTSGHHHHKSAQHSSQGHHHSGSHRERPQPSPSPSKPEGRKGPPIIIVPAAATARINMFNAKTFLETGVYRTPEECRDSGVKKQPFAAFHRTIGRDKPVLYHVTDKTPAKTHRDWHRVVAIIVTGAAWQFKGFPFKGAEEGDMVDTFARVLGIYVGFTDETMPENVKKWNVQKFVLQRGTRHRDMSVAKDMYTALDAFLVKRKSNLAY